MARHMVAECGMSPASGPVFVPAGNERHGGASEATRRAVDGEVAAMLVGAKEQVSPDPCMYCLKLHLLLLGLVDMHITVTHGPRRFTIWPTRSWASSSSQHALLPDAQQDTDCSLTLIP